MPAPPASTAPPSRQAARPSWIGFGQAMDTPAEQFASWLPYSAYLAAERLFVNRDSVGFMLEVMPQSGADERMAEVLVSLYANCPPGTGIQFHLFASPHIGETLRRLSEQIGAAPMVSVSCARLIRVDFLAAGDLLNWVLSRRQENRTIQFMDAHRLVALFFTAMGISEHAQVHIRKV